MGRWAGWTAGRLPALASVQPQRSLLRVEFLAQRIVKARCHASQILVFSPRHFPEQPPPKNPLRRHQAAQARVPYQCPSRSAARLRTSKDDLPAHFHNHQSLPLHPTGWAGGFPFQHVASHWRPKYEQRLHRHFSVPASVFLSSVPPRAYHRTPFPTIPHNTTLPFPPSRRRQEPPGTSWLVYGPASICQRPW